MYHRFDVMVTAETDTMFDAWVGAVLRNNLLCATEQIDLPDRDMSLFRYCRQFPLSAQHPLYNELKDGFPAPYYLYVRTPRATEMTKIQAGQTITFSLTLMGEISRYITCFMEAIDFMCRKGLGLYSKPFVLNEVREVSAMGENHLLFRDGEIISRRLLYPVDMETVPTVSAQSDCIRIVFESPVSLIKQRNRPDPPGYQEKSNLFPSFYQLVRTAAYRLEKLHALYAAPHDVDRYNQSHENMEATLEQAASPEIEEINLKRIELKSSRRKNSNETRIPLTGLIGDMTFRGNYKPYITLLKYMEQLGAGNHLTYGFGKYRIEMQ
ncbi:MAG: CRISPR system precrRNA processing endoribonuclease RAMP protein Cas6 [Tannerella sp.]|nr:CRISPR system precrRNA processing endoribonuclease RAMP protein Cas6 [Tannerella sp.]